MAFPTNPLNAVQMAWQTNCPPGTHTATVNGDVISSNTPEGVLRRFETWLNRHTDIGGPGKEDTTVELAVRGVRCMVLTPTGRGWEEVSGFPPKVLQWFDVKLWWQGKEYDSLWLDYRTCVWEVKEKKVRKVKATGQKPSPAPFA